MPLYVAYAAVGISFWKKLCYNVSVPHGAHRIALRGDADMLLLIGKKRLYAAGMILSAVLLLALVFSIKPRILSVMGEAAMPQRSVIILDAGHGGADGGAVSPDGVAESHINLAITQDLQAVLHLLGQATVLTRSGTDSLADPDCTTVRSQKVSDTKNRVALINGVEGGCLVSIHQNTLPGHPSVHGAQVFYNSNAPADSLAAAVQESLNSCINPGNEKGTKPIGKDVYIMSHAACPAILVECGFLSHTEETQRLQDASYQLKLAMVIACGCLQYSR